MSENNDKMEIIDEFIPKEIDMESSIKTNFKIGQFNWKNITIVINSIIENIKNLYNIIDIDYIIQQVIKSINNRKYIIEITMYQATDSTVIVESEGIFFNVFKKTDTTFEISNLNDESWNTTQLLTSLIAPDGSVIYPKILLFDNKITLIFDNNLTENYKLIFI